MLWKHTWPDYYTKEQEWARVNHTDRREHMGNAASQQSSVLFLCSDDTRSLCRVASSKTYVLRRYGHHNVQLGEGSGRAQT